MCKPYLLLASFGGFIQMLLDAKVLLTSPCVFARKTSVPDSSDHESSISEGFYRKFPLSMDGQPMARHGPGRICETHRRLDLLRVTFPVLRGKGKDRQELLRGEFARLPWVPTCSHLVNHVVLGDDHRSIMYWKLPFH